MRSFTELLLFFLILKCLLCGSEQGDHFAHQETFDNMKTSLVVRTVWFWGKLLFASREWTPRLLLSIPQYMRQTPLQILMTSTLVMGRETLVCLKVNLTRFPSELKS